MKEDWDQFWSGHGRNAALLDSPVGVELLQRAWSEYFRQFTTHPGSKRILDIASGAGEVARIAHSVLGAEATITGLDYSPHAVESLSEDSAISEALVGDARTLPFHDSVIDIVVSQFGIEYAGIEAFPESVRPLRKGGYLRIVAHHANGAIHRECAANRELSRSILNSGVFETSLVLFTNLRERQGEVALNKAVAEVHNSVPAFREAIVNAQPDIAGRAFAERLYNDFTKIFSRLKAFDPVDLINWGEAARTETRAYEARMAAMTEAALTEKDISIVMSHMESNNMIVCRSD